MTAPTTAKVRALVQSAWADAQSDGPYCDNVYAQGSHGGRAEALESIALPLAIERDGLAAQVATIVRELGGEVEGLPTQTINYLQRIRALRRVEAERDALAAEVARLREGNSRVQPEAQRVVQAADRASFDVGLYAKFRIERTDGSSRPGGKHEHCRYFVLDFDHDVYAAIAARAYAAACQARFPELATDLCVLAAKGPR